MESPLAVREPTLLQCKGYVAHFRDGQTLAARGGGGDTLVALTSLTRPETIST